MTAQTAVGGAQGSPTACWCCGCEDSPDRFVHLGNHPEVNICVRCAHWVRNRARALEDEAGNGPGARLRGMLRAQRDNVMRRGLHRHPVWGRPLRWLGRHLP